MARRVVEVTLTNLCDAPREVLQSVFWELDVDEPPADPVFQKEEWFSSTLLDWGPCGKLLLEDESIGFAEYGPAPLFPRLRRYRRGKVSSDAVYLSYCFVEAKHRGRGAGSELLRSAAVDLFRRGFRALESIGDREWDGGWVLPAAFLASNGFRVLREDARFPLMRLELDEAPAPTRRAEAVALPAPGPG